MQQLWMLRKAGAQLKLVQRRHFRSPVKPSENTEDSAPAADL